MTKLVEPVNIGFCQFDNLTVNQRVAGSSPAEGATKIRVTSVNVCDPFLFAKHFAKQMNSL